MHQLSVLHPQGASWKETGNITFVLPSPAVISREYSAEWKKGDEPYYPVNDEKNGALYVAYKQLADAEPGVLFGGRLGEYKYYDMDKVIEVALSVAEKELAE